MSSVLEEQQIINMKLDPSKVDEYFEGGKVSWKEVWFHSATYGRKSEIDRLATIFDPQNGNQILDTNSLVGCRLQVMIEKWNGFIGQPTIPVFDSMPVAVIEYMDQKLRSYMYPSATSVPNFFKAWRTQQKSSGQENPSEQTESTKES